MATSIRPVSIARDVAELMKANRRVGGAIAASQVPVPAKDRLVISTNGQPATWQLSAIPYLGDLGSSLNLSLNGLELDEAADYSVDYTTGLVTFSAGQQALFKATPSPADVLTADYWTSDDLIAQAQPADTGAFSDTFNRADSATTLGPSWSVTSLATATPVGASTWGISSNRAYCVASPSDGAGTAFDAYAYENVIQSADGQLDVDLPVVDASIDVAATLIGLRIDLANVGTNNLSGLLVNRRQVMVKTAGGGWTGLSFIYTPFTNGDHLTLILSGSSITLKNNGTTLWSGSSSVNATVANIGMTGNHTFSPGTRFDNFTWTPA